MTKHVLYLHGFASSPQSQKAQDLRGRLARYDVQFSVPDLNVPSFERLSFTAMLEEVARTIRALPAGTVYLIGSSLGGAVALHFADRYRQAEAVRVEKLVLLAPAIDFFANREQQLGERWRERWRVEGAMPFHHYAYDEVRPVHYGLIEDLQRYDGYSVALDIPIRIYHGRHDESVPYAQSVRYAQGKERVELYMLDSDHTLLDQTEGIFRGIVEFFELEEREGG